MELRFEKFHGAGNDFIFLDIKHMNEAFFTKDFIARACERRMGIGADGLIMVKPIKKNMIEMYYFNADGGKASFCGNGARCAVRYAQLKNWVERQGILLFDQERRSFNILDECIEIEFPIHDSPNEIENGWFIDTGSPHVVIELDLGTLDSYPVDEEGRSIRWSKTYASIGGTNVNFYEHKGEKIRMRTFERGVENETLACGTGTVAVGIVSRKKHFPEQNTIAVEAPGGHLEVIFKDQIWLKGPAIRVFEGILHL